MKVYFPKIIQLESQSSPGEVLQPLLWTNSVVLQHPDPTPDYSQDAAWTAIFKNLQHFLPNLLALYAWHFGEAPDPRLDGLG